VPGDLVHVEFSKWGDLAHWHLDMQRIGSDEYGCWLGAARGSQMTRPGTTVDFTYASVALVPKDEPWMAFFNEPETSARVGVYVDITTTPEWSEDTVRVIDLDLDVVRTWNGEIKVLDEDEFADHQIRFGYPPEIISLAERSCADVLEALRVGAEPFSHRGAEWLAQFTESVRLP
jgi:uncharacterized protein